MTKHQVEQVLHGIEAGDSTLKNLRLSVGMPLATVDPGLLAAAANRLEDLQLPGSRMTRQQVEAILTQGLVKTELKTLDLGVIYSEPEEDLLLRAKLIIQKVYVTSLKNFGKPPRIHPWE